MAFAAFFIEDAAITFSFSRNLIEGEGLVTYAGGERVEGYSNPLWTFLIAIFYLFKVPPFFAAKLLGGLFGAATLPSVYGIARSVAPIATTTSPSSPDPLGKQHHLRNLGQLGT